MPILAKYRGSLVSNEEIANKISQAILKDRMNKIREQNKLDMDLRTSKLLCQEAIPKSNNPQLENE